MAISNGKMEAPAARICPGAVYGRWERERERERERVERETKIQE